MNTAVIGLGFGDEGKGSVVDYFCSKKHNPMVVRFTGGSQCGHHVIYDKLDHVFSHFGSGSLRGVPTFWAKFCPVDPIALIVEMEILRSKGIEPKIFIDYRCPITTPFEKYINILNEEVLGHGSCGVGFGQTILREEDKFNLCCEDLFYPEIFKIKFNQIIKNYYENVRDVENLEFFEKCCGKILESKNIEIVSKIPESVFYIFEGAQGLLLDQDFGFFPNVTRANLGLKNIYSMGMGVDEVILVTRAYQTRHGNGPMTNENIPHNIKENPFEKNVENLYQGKFRKAILDLDLLKYSLNRDILIKKHQDKSIIMTCLDLVENEWRFTRKGEIVSCIDEDEFISRIKEYLDINVRVG